MFTSYLNKDRLDKHENLLAENRMCNSAGEGVNKQLEHRFFQLTPTLCCGYAGLKGKSFGKDEPPEVTM